MTATEVHNKNPFTMYNIIFSLISNIYQLIVAPTKRLVHFHPVEVYEFCQPVPLL